MSYRKGKAAATSFRVFVSYSTKDMATVQRVKNTLRAGGATVFVAEHSIAPGDGIKAGISAAINNCDLFVLLWSAQSASSDWVRHEVGHATAMGKRIVSFVLDERANIPPFLDDLKYIRAHQDFDGGLEALGKQVKNLFAAKKKQIDDRNAAFWIAIAAGAVMLSLADSDTG